MLISSFLVIFTKQECCKQEFSKQECFFKIYNAGPKIENIKKNSEHQLFSGKTNILQAWVKVMLNSLASHAILSAVPGHCVFCA